MNLIRKTINSKASMLLLSALLLTLFATSVSADSRTASLDNERSDRGSYISVHDGSTYVTAYNESGSKNSLYAKIKKPRVVIPDAVHYSTFVSPGSSSGETVALDPSSYYPYAESPRYSISGYVTIIE